MSGDHGDASPGADYDESGVDRSLIRESLGKSPAERLDLADSLAQEIEELRTHMDVPFRA